MEQGWCVLKGQVEVDYMGSMKGQVKLLEIINGVAWIAKSLEEAVQGKIGRQAP